MNPLRRLTRGILRVAAGFTVVAVIAVPVAVMAAIAGNPFTGDLLTSLGDRQVDNDQIIKLLSIAFYALWAWFAIPALRQVAVSLHTTTPTTRTGGRATVTRPVNRHPVEMPADEPGPRGWLARLVRFALGAATVATTITAVSTGYIPAVVAAPITVVFDDPTNPHDTTSIETRDVDHGEQVCRVTAQRRDTPYSIARRHFATQLDSARDELVALNTGRPTPNGTAWAGGTFPIGMTVITPYFETDTPAAPEALTAAVTTYQVRPNDGWINVVEGLWGPGTADRWQQLRPQLVGQQVAPGVVIDTDTTIIHPGWVFTHPGTPALTPPTADPAVHIIERGDRLYDLINDVLDEPITKQHIDAVAQHNDGMTTPDGTFVFSATNPDLIHPGQIVDLQPAIDLDRTSDLPAPTAEPADDTPTDPVPEPADTTTTEPSHTNDPVVGPADPVDVDVPVEDPVGGGVAPVVVPVADPVPTVAAGRPEPAIPPVPTVSEPVPTNRTDAPAGPTVTAPAPPVPIPANAVTAPAEQPGDTAATPPTIAEPHPTASGETTSATAPYALLAAGGLSLAGLFIALDRRRRKARAKRPHGTSIAAPEPTDTHDEHVIRVAAHVDRATRVNLAVRHLGRQLADRDAPLRARYLLADTDTVTVVFDRPVELADGWTEATLDHSWTCTLTDDELADFADDPTPWPALVPIGTLDDGTDVLLDIEGLGSLGITGPNDIVDRFIAALVTSISSSPYADLLTYVDNHSIALHGLDRHLPDRLTVDSIDALIARLHAWIAPFDFDHQHLIAARRDMGGEYEPCIAAIVTDLDDNQRTALNELPLAGSHPIAVLTTDISIAATVLHLDNDGVTIIDGHSVRCHRLEPVTAAVAATLFDVVDTPKVINRAPLDEYNRLTHSIANTATNDIEDTDVKPEPAMPNPVAPRISLADVMLPPEPGQLFDTEPEVEWTIRVLGPLEIMHRDGTHLSGPKVRELATLLAMHPSGVPSVELKQMLGNETAGLTTRISELRKLLGAGDTVAGRTYLPANKSARGYYLEGVRVDCVRLARCLDHARKADGHDKINWLVGALELVRGQIGTGELTAFRWAGHLLTTLEASIIEAGVELARLAADHENWTIVDWAANQVRLANPYEQRVIPLQIQERNALGDEVGIRRLHDDALDDVDQFEPDVAEAFHTAFARQAR